MDLRLTIRQPTGGARRAEGQRKGNVLKHEVIDIRRFEPQAFGSLLEAESRAWYEELRWDFGASARVVSNCLRERRLAGYALVCEDRIRGYCFFFYDGEKGLIGDLFLDPSAAGNDFAHQLLDHAIETLLATPGLRRVEAQLPHFPFAALDSCFRSHGFQCYRRRFMERSLGAPGQPAAFPAWSVAEKGPPALDGFVVLPWERTYDRAAAELLHLTYRNHVDAGINDQYCSPAGTTRLIENIVLQQGCGEYLSRISRLAIHRPSQKLAGVLAVTAVRPQTAHIPQVAVPPPYQGYGVGTLLMESAFQALGCQGYREISLTVTDANARAVKLYERLGFRTFREFGAFVYQKG